MNKVEIAHTQTLDDIIMAVSFAEAAGDISLIYGDINGLMYRLVQNKYHCSA